MDEVTDEDLLREVMNTVGKGGKPWILVTGTSVVDHHLKCLGQPTRWQPGGRGVRCDPFPERSCHRAAMTDLADVRLDSADLVLEEVGDVNVVVGLWRVDEPDLRHRPRFEAISSQSRMSEEIASVRIYRSKSKLTGGTVIDVTAGAKPRPVPLRTPSDHTLRPNLSDDPNQLPAQRRALRQLTLMPAQKGSSPDPVGNGECRDHAGLALVTVGRGSLPAMRYAIVIILFLVR